MQKCIYLIPEHPQIHEIEQLRSQFDPAAQRIPAHVTLVFPFVPRVSDLYLVDAMNDLGQNYDPIEFVLGPLICVDSYGFLPVVRGRRLITELHDRLYGGELRPHLSAQFPYMPHLTVGRYNNEEACSLLRHACENLQLNKTGLLSEMVLVDIADDSTSHVGHQARLRQNRTSALEWLQSL
jgi:2'-5' RNA ligase